MAKFSDLSQTTHNTLSDGAFILVNEPDQNSSTSYTTKQVSIQELGQEIIENTYGNFNQGFVTYTSCSNLKFLDSTVIRGIGADFQTLDGYVTYNDNGNASNYGGYPVIGTADNDGFTGTIYCDGEEIPYIRNDEDALRVVVEADSSGYFSNFVRYENGQLVCLDGTVITL